MSWVWFGASPIEKKNCGKNEDFGTSRKVSNAVRPRSDVFACKGYIRGALLPVPRLSISENRQKIL